MKDNGAPLVSIIVPCFNYGNFLGYTLSNILEQTYSNWHCVIVDDGSSDNTKTVAGEFIQRDSRFSYVYQTNAGLSAARNTGIRHAHGKYVQLLDADDLIAATKLQMQVAFLEGKPQVDIVYGDGIFFNSEEMATKEQGIRDYNSTAALKMSGCGVEVLRNFCKNNFIEVSAPLIRKSVFDRVGEFDTTYFTYEDWQFWIRCGLKGLCFAYDPEQGTETYIRYGHVSMLRNSKKKVAYGIKLRQYIMEHLPAQLKLYNVYRLSKLYIKKLLVK